MQDLDLAPKINADKSADDKESIGRIRQVLKANLLAQVQGADIIDASASFLDKYQEKMNFVKVR